MQVSFRCKSMTYDEYHHILVPDKGFVICSCQGVGWCSHIEATLVCGERFMVPEEDRVIANQAQILAKGRIGPPEDWKADWRNNRKWRGLPVRIPKALEMLKKGYPVVSFQGSSKLRKEAKIIAEENGWAIAPRPSNGVIVHAALDGKKGKRTEYAKEVGAMVVYGDDWKSIALIGQTLRLRMADLLRSKDSPAK